MQILAYKGFSWPTIAFIASICLAIGHHAFYNYLDGRQTPNSIRFQLGKSFRVSDQQKNIVIGTLLAVLVKGLAYYSMSAAHMQTTWMTIKAQETKCDAIDAGFRTTPDPRSLLKWTLWLRNPLMMLVAVLFWYESPVLIEA